MFASMLGSMLQLPAVGGGSQMATIATLSSVFDAPPEVSRQLRHPALARHVRSRHPSGLILAHREHLSLRELSKESHHKEGS